MGFHGLDHGRLHIFHFIHINNICDLYIGILKGFLKTAHPSLGAFRLLLRGEYHYFPGSAQGFYHSFAGKLAHVIVIRSAES